MPKPRTRFVCQNCADPSPQWLGKCPNCGQFNTMVEERIGPDTPQIGGRGALRRGESAGSAREFQVLRTVSEQRSERTSSGIGELDRVLGGGIVPGSVVLIGGEPGIGKSTLLGQMANNLAAAGQSVAYVSGEESVGQIKLRAERLGLDSDLLYVLNETDLETIISSVGALKPDLFIMDSIQTVTIAELTGAAGSVGQVREGAQYLARFAKSARIPTFIVSHVTKEGSIAGPHALEHIVDAVLYLEGDRFHTYRMLRAAKNRFGSVDEVGVFQMEGQGLREISNPSEIFLSEESIGAPGSVVAATIEGSRPLLVEVQALTAESIASFPRRTVSGLDLNRVNVVCASLAKQGLDVYRQDVYVNLTGGLRTDDPACDLAIASAIASAFSGCAVPEKTVVIGEVGLTGEVRKVGQLQRRLDEAARLGFTSAVTPKGQVRAPTGMALRACGTLAEVLTYLRFARPRVREGAA